MTIVVQARGNSRNSEARSDDSEIGKPGQPLAQNRCDPPFMRRIAVGMQQADRDRADAGGSSFSAAATTEASSSGVTTAPAASIRSSTSKQRSRGTSGFGFSANTS